MITYSKQLCENEKMFRKWLDTHSDSDDDAYKDHAVDVLRNWLDEKMPNLDIKNLFRFDNLQDYDSCKERIVTAPSFKDVNDKDSCGRPNAALNHYSNYLKSFVAGTLKRELEQKYPSERFRNGRRIISADYFKKPF